MVGHTHDMIDQVFSRVSVYVHIHVYCSYVHYIWLRGVQPYTHIYTHVVVCTYILYRHLHNNNALTITELRTRLWESYTVRVGVQQNEADATDKHVHTAAAINAPGPTTTSTSVSTSSNNTTTSHNHTINVTDHTEVDMRDSDIEMEIEQCMMNESDTMSANGTFSSGSKRRRVYANKYLPRYSVYRNYDLLNTMRVT